MFTIDVGLRVYSHDKIYRYSNWTVILYFVILAHYIHCILSSIYGVGFGWTLALTSLRPYYLIFGARQLRSVIKSILRSVPKILHVVIIIAFVVCVFGVGGYELFNECSKTYFNDIERSLLTLIVLLTTANFPDCMMEAYNASQYNVIFFVIYVILILVLLLPTVLAVVYESYHAQTEQQYGQISRKQKMALRFAFEVLTEPRNFEDLEETSVLSNNIYYKPDISYETRKQKFIKQSERERVVTQKQFELLLFKIRPKLQIPQIQVIYTSLRLDEGLMGLEPNEARNILKNRKDGLNKTQFLKLCEFIEIKFYISPKAKQTHRMFRYQLYTTLRLDDHDNCRNRISNKYSRLKLWLLYALSHPLTDSIIDWLIWINIMILVGEYYNTETQREFVLKFIHLAFIGVFLVEMMLKLFIFGIKVFMEDTFLIFDFTLVMLSAIISIIHYGSEFDSALSVLRSLRLLRLLRQFPKMRLIIIFFTTLARAFFILFLAQFSLFYAVSQFGILLFYNVISKETMENRMNDACQANINGTECAYWHSYYDPPTYYYLNNMNSFINTMIVLIELTVVCFYIFAKYII